MDVNQAILTEALSQLEADHPEMFGHPSAKKNEIWLGDFHERSLTRLLDSYAELGLSTIRKESPNAASRYPVFVDMYEYARMNASRVQSEKSA